jgi:hypothetical protein
MSLRKARATSILPLNIRLVGLRFEKNWTIALG